MARTWVCTLLIQSGRPASALVGRSKQEADEIVFAAPVAALPLVRRDNFLNDQLRRYAEEALARPPRRRGNLRSAVEDILPQLLPHGRACASEVARRLGMSSRTLSRKLHHEGLGFADISNELRAALAQRYLLDRELPISEIAWLLVAKSAPLPTRSGAGAA
jgi:AraC-like DNA-binding protein